MAGCLALVFFRQREVGVGSTEGAIVVQHIDQPRPDFGRQAETFQLILQPPRLDVDRLVYEADPILNLPVRPRDIIYVPNIQTMRIFMSGALNKPDVYEVPKNRPVTLLKAITIAGGTTDRAALKRVQIIRTDANGHRITLDVNLRKVKNGKSEDPVLQEEDLILVPEGLF